VTEVRDGIDQLTARAASPEIAEAMIRKMAWYDAYLGRGGVDRSANTTPGNKRGGLSNIVEKAMGSILEPVPCQKAGVVSPGNRVGRIGLNYAATPPRRYAATPPRRHAATPPRRYAATPPRRHAATPLRRYAATPPRRHAATPLRRHAATPASDFICGTLQVAAASICRSSRPDAERPTAWRRCQ
jgi:hypothetical protein